MGLARRRAIDVRMVQDEPRVKHMGTAMMTNTISLGRWRTRVLCTKPSGWRGLHTVERVTSAVEPRSCSNRDFDQKIVEFDHRFVILDWCVCFDRSLGFINRVATHNPIFFFDTNRFMKFKVCFDRFRKFKICFEPN
jgi:hypothetical protein